MKTQARHKEIKLAVFNRLFLLLIVFSIWIAAILARLIFIQAFHHEEYALRSDSQQKAFIEVSNKRGDILDRNLEELATSVQAVSVYADPQQIINPMEVSRALASVLGKPEEELLEKFDSKTRFTYLKRQVAPRIGRAIEELQLKGIHIQKENKRVYPNRELAAHILGFVGIDGKGLGGLEYFFDKNLKGEKTRIDIRVDAHRNSFNRSSPISGKTGETLVLTLDKTIQHIAENALKQAINRTGALNGSVVVMDPFKGEILAMASFPFFNPNNHQNSPAEHRRNRVILDLYEPGSTFKLVTLSSVLNEGLSDPLEVIDCRVGTARIANKVYREAYGSYEDLTFTEILAKSSNVGTVKLGLRLGEKPLYEYVKRFGFGVETGIDLPGEEAGILRPTTSWSKISIGAISIGQEIATTPLQLVRAAASIANGGYLVKPRIIRRIVSPDGEVILEKRTEKTRILKADTARIMRTIMREVVLSGTGKKGRLNVYSSAGKTGTAQKIVNGLYSKSRYVASFVGFAPFENPVLICLVVINEPKGATHGGPVAGPVFKEIMERSLLYLKVPKSHLSDFEKASLLLAPRITDQSRSKASPSVMGNSMVPDPDETGILNTESRPVLAKTDQMVTISLSNKKMPDLRGKTLREVAVECARFGIKPKIKGSGIAVGQRPAAGSRITRNMVCEIFFSPKGEYAVRNTVVEDSRRIDPGHEFD